MVLTSAADGFVKMIDIFVTKAKWNNKLDC